MWVGPPAASYVPIVSSCVKMRSPRGMATLVHERPDFDMLSFLSLTRLSGTTFLRIHLPRRTYLMCFQLQSSFISSISEILDFICYDYPSTYVSCAFPGFMRRANSQPKSWLEFSRTLTGHNRVILDQAIVGHGLTSGLNTAYSNVVALWVL